MTAQFMQSTPNTDDPLRAGNGAVEAAREYIASTALAHSSGGLIGLELEFHLLDLARPHLRPTWDEVRRVVATLPAMPCGSSVTVEPGGQLELSTPPQPGAAAAISALQTDRRALAAAVRAAGYGTAPLGADPARAPRRINPHPRYVAMEQHFTAVGCGDAGRAMMTSTAALQINVDAGAADRWASRLAHIRTVAPMLVAASACSPYLAGTSSGWRSMRQQIWHGVDHGRSDPVADAEPGDAWASYALDAPLMLLRDRNGDRIGDRVTPMTERIPLRDWLGGEAPIGRRPTLADVGYHLTTLFPPIRPRGYVEIRCLDALPDRWWPALVALAATVIDDAVAADGAAELCAPVRDRWSSAARHGVGDKTLQTAVLGCVEAALARCDPTVKQNLEAYALLVERGQTPGDELRARADEVGPLTLLEEEARA